jgi:hypothetical protein
MNNKKQKIEFCYFIIKKKIFFYGTVLERPEFVSDLGVLFDNKLSFTGHINSVIKIPGRPMAILRVLGIPEISLISPH